MIYLIAVSGQPCTDGPRSRGFAYTEGVRGGHLLLVASALFAPPSPDPSHVLAQARDKIVANRSRLPNYICRQTVNRSYFRSPKQSVSFPACAESRAGQEVRDSQLSIYLTDRFRLDVKVSGGVEIGSWAGSSKFADNFDFIGRGPFGTGAFGTFLSNIFDNSVTSFSYKGVVMSDSGDLYEYGFQIPRAASHYLVKAGADWQAVAYEGEADIDPHSLDLRHLRVRSNSLPAASEACTVATDVEYAMAQLNRGDFLLPRHSRLHIVTASTDEDDIDTTYSACREFQSESTVSFVENAQAGTAAKSQRNSPAGLPPGLSILLALAEPINTDNAAAGDVVLERVRKAVRANGSKEVLIPAGTTVRGRIVRMQHWIQPPPQFTISIQLETWESGGVSVPIFAKPDHSGIAFAPSAPTHGVPTYLPAAAYSPRVRAYAITTDRVRYVLPRGFQSNWITVAPSADQ